MFNIFRDERELMSNSTDVRELFRRVQHPELQNTVKALEFREDLEGIKYLEADNHLTAAVYKIPENQFSRKVSRMKSSGGNNGGISGGDLRKSGCDSGSIYNSQGKVHTGYYHNWKGPSKEYCKTVINARNKRVASLVRPQSRKM